MQSWLNKQAEILKYKYKLFPYISTLNIEETKSEKTKPLLL